MVLPVRDYLSVAEVIARWQASPTDMRHYLESGKLEAQVLLDSKHAQIYHRFETPGKEEGWIKKNLITLSGYVVIQPEQIQKIFLLKSTPIHKFKALHGPDHYKLLQPKEGCPLSLDDLWIARPECLRFEAAHQLEIRIQNGAMPPMQKPSMLNRSFAGRPSVMRKITSEYARRAQSGMQAGSLSAEASQLHAWALGTIQDMQVPTPRSIANAIRDEYRQTREKTR